MSIGAGAKALALRALQALPGRGAHAAIALGWSVCLVGATAAHAAALVRVELTRPEGPRHYLVAAPADGDERRALVILLHGHGGSAAQILGQRRSAAPMSTWLRIAERERLVVAAPDGIAGRDGRPGWNDCRDDAEDNPTSDDVATIDALIAREIERHHVDPQRIYAMGMSNGGVFAYRLAAELAHPLAGFVAVAASMPAHTRCPAPMRPTSALVIGGTADPLMPWGGGEVGFAGRPTRGAVIGAEASAAVWRRLDGLPAGPSLDAALQHRDRSDPTRVERIVWGSDVDGLQVELLRVDQGGHVEPSIDQRYGRLYLRIVGAQNGDVESAEEAWRFLKTKRHTTRSLRTGLPMPRSAGMSASWPLYPVSSRGSLTVNSAPGDAAFPVPGRRASATTTLPPWRCTISCTMASPSPLPSTWVSGER